VATALLKASRLCYVGVMNDSQSQPSAADSDTPGVECFVAEIAEPTETEPQRAETAQVPRRRKVTLPVILFLLTCVSTFVTGALHFAPVLYVGNGTMHLARRFILTHWQDGITFMLCVLGILLAHELGHFIATVLYRIPASLPIFLPFPVSPLGTLGAVIVMDGKHANRKQIFDIGIAGPLAGLVIAFPVLWIGLQQLDFSQQASGIFAVDIPLAVRWMILWQGPEGYTPSSMIGQDQLNPYFMAGWVGCLVTSVNMIPVSQLDGGHISYTLFGKAAHKVARGFMIFAVAYIVYMGVSALALMLLLVLLMGTDHQPTKDDSVPIGWFRFVLGLASLSIPLLLMPPRVMIAG